MVVRLSWTLVLSWALCAGGCGEGSVTRSPDASVASDGSGSSDARRASDAAANDAVRADARPAALDCLGQPLPDTAPNPLTISGSAFNPGIPGVTPDTPIDGATIESFARGNEVDPLATTTSDQYGDYALSAVNSTMAPMDAYVRASAASYWTTYLYPPSPVAANQSGVQLVMTTTTQFDLVSSLGRVTPDSARGFVSLVVIDCAGDPVAGAVVTTEPSTDDVIYMDEDGTPSDTAVATAEDGIALLFNVPVGAVELRARAMGMDLRPHAVTVKPTNHEGAAGDESFFTTLIGP